MSIVKPEMFILEIEDIEVFENFIVEWVNHDPVVHLHQYRSDLGHHVRYHAESI